MALPSNKSALVQDKEKCKSVNLLQIYFDKISIFKAMDDSSLKQILKQGKMTRKYFQKLKKKYEGIVVNNTTSFPIDEEAEEKNEEEIKRRISFLDLASEIETLPHPSAESLTIPRLIILLALEAARRDVTFQSALQYNADTTGCPIRLNKFTLIMYDGLWYVGRMIEQSLSPDPVINKGNPFKFENGDLGFWWGAIIIMDWLSYCNSLKKYDVPAKSFIQMNQPKYGMNERMAGLHMRRASCYFLSSEDANNYKESIENVKFRVPKHIALLDLV